MFIHIYIFTYIYICIYVYVYVYVCVICFETTYLQYGRRDNAGHAKILTKILKSQHATELPM